MSSAAVAALVLGVGTVFFVIVLAFRKQVHRAREELASIAAGRQALIQSSAQSYGIRSRGRTQARGLGYAALFPDELVFQQALAKNHVRASRVDIVRVTTPGSFLGKTGGRRLLAIEWKTAGDTDQVALRVADLDAWLRAFEQAGIPIDRS